MCGIAGIISRNSGRDKCKAGIYSMMGLIAHRGPDAEGAFVDEANGVYFGHKRLSIIDLSPEANQPFSSNASTIIFNGEIYNYLEIKKEYFNGHKFATKSDTEVIIALYEKFGIEKTLSLLRGMFVFALFDRARRIIFICRDHIGKKPLYYFTDPEGIYFASEAKAFKDLGKSGLYELDENSMNDCLYYRFTAELSPFKNIRMLPNGHYLEIGLPSTGMKVKEYFNFSSLVNADVYAGLGRKSISELSAQLDDLLATSVRRRLIADTEVASIASGGIDSSLITAIAYGIQKIRMLHIDVAGLSEKKYAGLLASKLGSGLLVRQLDIKNIEENIDRTIYHYEYFLVHPNSIGIAMLSSLSRENGIKVLLGGDGADELFCGYRFQMNYYLGMLMKKCTLGAAPKLFNRNSRIFRKYLGGPDTVKSYVNDTGSRESGFILERQSKAETDYGFIKDPLEREFNAFQLTILNEYLQPLLLRADKMGMMHSVEIRSPFLDLEVIKFALNLPLRFKINISGGKMLLKLAAKKYIPREIINRRKLGFPIPLPKNYSTGSGEHYGRSYVKYSSSILKNINFFKTEGEVHI